MAADAETAAAPPPSWPVLSVPERRVLGVLVEKSKTTPDVYPMSMNALVAGCNQKSNRDPLLDLSEAEVEEALVSAKQKGLAIMVTGGRVVRWRQALYEAWIVNKVELALLAELLLRGPQTEGELRSRASRMEPIADLDTLRELLRPLAERGLIVYLTPEGRRGTMVTHGFHAPEELQRLHARHGSVADEEDVPPRTAPHAGLEERLTQAETALAALQAQVETLTAQLRMMQEALGIDSGSPSAPAS
jgi:hypothetical protein